MTQSRQHAYNGYAANTKGAPPPPPGKAWPAWILPTLTGIAGAMIGLLLGFAALPAATGAAACEAALDYADKVIEVQNGAFLDVADAMDAYQDGNYSAMNRHSDSLGEAADEVHATVTNYQEAKGECLKN